MVDGAFFTSPKVLSRKSVRKSEVLPVLVWPTTARESGVVMVVGWVDMDYECVSMEPFIFSGNICFRRP